MSISSILEIGKRSLFTQQNAIDIGSRNIANVNTAGYSRRRIDILHLSLGVENLDENSLRRIRNEFVEGQIQFENMRNGKYGSQEMLMEQMEGIFAEPSDSGLANMMSEFWAAWNNLSNDPDSSSARALVKDKSILVTNTFNRLDTNLKGLQSSISSDIQSKAREINGVLKQIKAINESIGSNMSDDILDQRDILVDKLSNLIDIQVTESSTGELSILANGHLLISGDYIDPLTVKITADRDGLFTAQIFQESSETSEIHVTSGELGGLLEMHNGKISEYVEKLDTYALNVAASVNKVHRSGFNISGDTGINFFSDNMTGAGDMRVNTVIINDSSLIATSNTEGETGNGNIAMDIANIQHENVIQGYSPFEFYNTMISNLGNDVSEVKFLKSNQASIINNLLNQRDAVSGVSLDEEMTKMMQFEQAYQAAAKVINIADELTQTVLSII